MFHRLNQIMEVATEFINEKWLDNLIIEQDTFWKSVMLSGHMVSVWDWEVVLECLEHLLVLELESAHDVLTSQEKVHQASHQNSLGVFLAFIIHGNNIDEVHE